MTMLKFNHVKKKYGDHVLTVKDFHLEVAEKEFLVLVGPSGCGKSTTLRMIAGLEDISEGELFIGNQIINDVPPKKRDIAMVFQNYALYPHMSIYDNIAFGLKLRKMPKEEIDKRVKEAAGILGLEHLLDRKPKELSGGQRQRVALGRAIVREPKVFLMDEPLSNLDAKLRVQMRTQISKLHKRLGVTTVYVTHDQTEAMTMGDRIVVMYDGLIQQVASPEEIYHFPANKYVASFIGSPSMNFLTGQIIEQGGQLYFKDSHLFLAIPKQKADSLRMKGYVNQAIILGIRPEDINDEMDEALHGKSIIEAKIDVIENMGSELFLYVMAGETMVTARIKGGTELALGKQISLAINMMKVHFFDTETEEAIR